MGNNVASWPFEFDEGSVPVMGTSVLKAKKDIAISLVDPNKAAILIERLQNEQESPEIKIILLLLRDKDAEVFALFIDHIENWFQTYNRTFGPEKAQQFLEILFKNLTQKTLTNFPKWLEIIYILDPVYAEKLATKVITQQAGLSLRNFDSWIAVFVAYFGIKKLRSILESFADLNQNLFEQSNWIDLFEHDPDFVKNLADQNLKAFPAAIAKYPDNFSKIYGKEQVIKSIQDYAREDFRGALNLRGHYRHLGALTKS
jgi:hypothetical protein